MEKNKKFQMNIIKFKSQIAEETISVNVRHASLHITGGEVSVRWMPKGAYSRFRGRTGCCIGRVFTRRNVINTMWDLVDDPRPFGRIVGEYLILAREFSNGHLLDVCFQAFETPSKNLNVQPSDVTSTTAVMKLTPKSRFVAISTLFPSQCPATLRGNLGQEYLGTVSLLSLHPDLQVDSRGDVRLLQMYLGTKSLFWKTAKSLDGTC